MNKLLLKPFLNFVSALDERLDTKVRSRDTKSHDTHEGLVVDVIDTIQRLSSDLVKERRLLSPATVDEVRYVMAAWSDELLISRWPKDSSSTEVNASVEQRLFQTMEAGEKIFWCIDRVLSRCSDGDLQLAPVYLTLLAMGYRGQYSDSERPQRLRAQLEDLCKACGLDKAVDAPLSKPLVEAPFQRPQRSVPFAALGWSLAGTICISCLLYADWHWQRSIGFIDTLLTQTSSSKASLPADNP